MPLPIEVLFDEELWDEVRKRLKRFSNPKKIGKFLADCVLRPGVPEDILSTLLSKVQRKCGSYRMTEDVDHTFFPLVCGYEGERDPFNKERILYDRKSFSWMCHNQTSSALRLFVEPLIQYGPISYQSVRDALCAMWSGYMQGMDLEPRDSDFQGGFCSCILQRANELMAAQSLEDLQTKSRQGELQVLHDLWEKTELLIKASKEGGLIQSLDEWCFIATLVRMEVPRLILWFSIKMYPHNVKKAGTDGRLALHWAAVFSNVDTEEEYPMYFPEGKLSRLVKARRTVEIVLDAFPEAARRRDAQGVLPLTLLLDLDYRDWQFQYLIAKRLDFDHNKSRWEDWSQRCVLALVEAAPETLQEKNKDSLPPFMAAACIHEDLLNQISIRARVAWRHDPQVSREHTEQRKLELTYKMLLRNPAVLALGLVGCPTDRDLFQMEANCDRSELGRKGLRKGNSHDVEERPAKKTKEASF